MKLNEKFGCHMTDKEIYKVANSRLGWYRRSGMYVVNYLLSPAVLAIKKKERPGLVNPLAYYMSKSWLQYKCSAVYETRTYGAMGGARLTISLYSID